MHTGTHKETQSHLTAKPGSFLFPSAKPYRHTHTHIPSQSIHYTFTFYYYFTFSEAGNPEYERRKHKDSKTEWKKERKNTALTSHNTPKTHFTFSQAQNTQQAFTFHTYCTPVQYMAHTTTHTHTLTMCISFTSLLTLCKK